MNGTENLQFVRGGTDEWYWVMDYTSGDLYEAEELFQMKHEVEFNRLYLIHYREETVVRALRSGEVLKRFPGDIRIMPNGDKWHLK